MERYNDLTTQIAAAILTNNDIGQAVIEVEHRDGSIILRGLTATPEDRVEAENIASIQAGGVEVINELKCE